MVVEHPVRNEWRLVEPAKPSEQSRDVYRFEMKVPAGKSVEQQVVEEQMRRTQLALATTDDRVVRVFLASRVTAPKVKESLQKAVDLRNQEAATKRELAHLEKQLKAINDDQVRLRANIEKLPPTSAAYKRSLEKIDRQEPQIEKLQEQIQKKQEEEKKQRQDYEDYLAGLTVE